MKKIIALIISAIVIFSMCIFSASAAGSGIIVMSSASAKQGDSVTLNVTMPSNPGLVTMSIKVTYDTNVLQLTNVTDSKLLVGSQLNTNYTSPYKITWADGSTTTDNKKTGTIATFTFKVKDNAQIGDSVVNLEIEDSYDTNYAENSFTASSGKITVICKNHNYGAWQKVNDTQHKRVCSACGHTETVNHTWNSGTITKQASCKEEGNKKFTCTACGAEKNETIAKTSSHSWSGYTVTKQPTCTATGIQTRTCSVCGKSGTQVISALGHSMGNWVQTKAPTCTSNGEEKRSCSKCGHSETRAINALGHSFSNPKITKEPTCTESGIETGKCTRCGQATTNTIKPTGHKFGAWEDVKKATCTEGGTQKRVCSKCKTEETRNTDALGHDFDNPTVVKEATISSTGLMEGKCKRCGEATQEVIPCTAKDDNTGIEFEANEGVFAEGTQMMVEEIKQDNPTYESVKNILSGISDTFTVYDISAVLNGAEVQPNGEVVVTFNIPEGYGTDVAVFYIFDEGTYEKLESIVSEDGKTISVKLNHFSNYAVCKLGTSNSANTDTIDKPVEQPTESNNTLWIIIAIVAVILIAGVATALILVKKKKTDNPDDSGMFL